MKIKEILVERDGLSQEEAQSQIDDAKEQLNKYLEAGEMEDAYNICSDFFGLEPDYLDELY